MDAIGGEDGCRNLAFAFYGNVARAPELRILFPGKSLRCASEEFSAFLIQFLGGDERQAQYRWWLSLRESHARFRITESQRVAWLRQMETTLRSSELDAPTQDALLQLFSVGSAELLGRGGEPVQDPELAARWSTALDLDELVALIEAGNDAEVLDLCGEFAPRPCLFVGVLARMMRTGRRGLVEAVTKAVQQDPSLGDRQYAGKALIHYAAGCGCREIVAALLCFGVDANLADSSGHSPLYRLANECSSESGPEIVRILVEAGADVNRSGGVGGVTPLHAAARWGRVEIAKALLEAGASREVRDGKGRTPLDRAINCRKAEVARLLSP